MLEELDSFEVVNRDEYAGQKVLATHFVDTEGTSRFVAKEFNTGATDEFYAKATTMTTNKLIDIIATKRCHARLVMDISRAFLHLEEKETVLVEPPKMWKEK